MTARTPAIRLAPIALAALVAAAFFAGSASGRSAEVVFMSGQHRIVKGNEATVTVGVLPKGSRCSLSVRYKGGTPQRGLEPITAPDGIAKWTWTVPRTVKTGPARVTASCGSAGRASRTLTVIGGVIPAKIRVVKSGWSLRPLPFGGTSVSYGVILANDSPQQDAQDVTVLVNFVMADNRLIGSATVHVSDIQAGSEHATGGDLTFPGSAPIARLEFVVQIGKRGPATHDKPGVSSVRVTPSIFEPTWCGGVEGEI